MENNIEEPILEERNNNLTSLNDVEVPVVVDTQTETPKEIIFPEETKFKGDVNCCCCIQMQRTMPASKVYCGYWEATFCMPISVILLILGPFIVFLCVSFVNMTALIKVISLIEILLFMTLFFVSYFAALAMDPGYLPYDWIKTKKTKYGAIELISGTAIRKDQCEFAEKYRCPFASFSRSSGRFVIRSDHICGWVTNWIAKRNHKQFMLMLLYGGIYAASLFIWQFFGKPGQNRSSLVTILMLITDSIEFIFGVMLIWTFFANIYDLVSNETQISKYKGVETEKLGCIDSMRQVCGNGNICCWLCPQPAFGDNELDYLLT